MRTSYEADGKRIVFEVGVVGEDIAYQDSVFEGRVGVVICDGRLVDMRDGDVDSCRASIAIRVVNLI